MKEWFGGHELLFMKRITQAHEFMIPRLLRHPVWDNIMILILFVLMIPMQSTTIHESMFIENYAACAVSCPWFIAHELWSPAREPKLAISKLIPIKLMIM